MKSKRQVIYDSETYGKLKDMWKKYYDEYPSEYAYANWMYAARYAEDRDYSKLLDRGLKKYPANPTLLYLRGIEHLGMHGDAESRGYLERAVALDENYVDPWFPLVTFYMDMGDEERVNLALRRILESGIITDEVMDYNYNVLLSLDDNAILITNGDNDTYPGWILTRVLGVRPDVAIVNRSLLNTEWYPPYVIEHSVPRFIGREELTSLRNSLLSKSKGAAPSPGGLFGDTLVVRIIESAERSGRPVYLAKTVYVSEMLRGVFANGRDLGLVTLVTPSQAPFADQLHQVYGKWLSSFRTGGLESWRLKEAPATDAGKVMMCNYAAGLTENLKALKQYAPDLRAELFRWYTQYIEGVLSDDMRSKEAMAWCCSASDVKEIDAWSKRQGIKCEEPVKP
ncbi:MAG TPA: hypothetical protein VMU02_04150 [bacterium]|nr:hypothetical protein [bacterium]